MGKLIDLSEVFEKNKDIKIVNENGECLKSSKLVMDEDGTKLLLNFSGEEITDDDNFDFEQMRKEREQIKEDNIQKIYKDLCKYIKTYNQAGKNSFKYLFDTDEHPEDIIAVLKRKLEDKGFNVRTKSDKALSDNFIYIIIVWS